MTEAQTEAQPKKRRTLTDEQKAKMAAGRARKAEERRQAKEAEQERGEAPEEPAPLVRTNSAAIREAQRGNNGQSLEDVVQRHVARDAGLTDSDTEDAPYEDYDDPPRSSFHGADDAVPAPAVRPELRDRPTVSVRDEGDDAIQYIPDIMREWGGALDAGTCYIRVERKRPPSHDGLTIRGPQRPIRQSITEKEFIDIYGGGNYDLVVYGPSQRGHQVDSNGRTRHRRLSGTINITIPGIPPNIDAVLEEEDEEMQGMQSQGNYRGVRRTNADASAFRTELEFEERRELRGRDDQERRVADERNRADQIQRESASALREMRQSHDSAMQMLRDNHQMQMDMMKQQMESMEKRFQDNQAALAKKPTESELVVDFAKAQLNSRAGDPEHIARVEQAAASQREQLTNQHREEIRHMRDEHRQEVERLQRQMEDDRRRGEDRVEEARKAIDERIREIQRQADARVADAEKRAEREVKTAKEDAERRIRDTESSYKARLEDLDRSHTRDLEAKNDSFTTRKESLENTHKTELASINAELSRLREENERLREENKKPLGERMEEFRENAEMMGFSKSDGNEEKDWKSTLVETGMGVLGQLPQIVNSVSATLQARQRPPQQMAGMPMPQQLPPPVQGRGGGIAASRPDMGGWATEDGPSLGDEMPNDSWMPEVPGEVPEGPTLRPHFAPDSSDIAQPPARPQPPPQQAPQPPPQRPATAGAPVHQIVPQQQQQQPRPNPAPESGQVEITDDVILNYSQALSAAVEQGASAEEYFEAFVQQWGPDMVHAITDQISVERITSVLQEHDETNPLLRRDGQQFLQQIWALASQQK